MEYNTKELLSVGEFAHLLKTTKATLHHYDSLGVLKPAVLGENGYRYYHPDQAQVFLVIMLFSDCGLPLKDIQSYLETFDAECGLKLVESAAHVLKEQIRKLTQLSLLLENKHRLYLASTTHEYWVPFLHQLPERQYFKSSRPIHSEQLRRIHTDHSIGISRYVMEHGEFPEHPFISHAKISRTPEGVALIDYPEEDTSAQLCTHPAGTYISLLCKGMDYTAEEAVTMLLHYADSNGYTLSDDLYMVDTINFVITRNADEYSLMFFVQVLDEKEKETA